MESTNVIEYDPKQVTISVESVQKQDIPKYLDKEEINSRIMSIENSRDRIYCLFLWMSGVRVTESVSFKKKDLDFKNNTVLVRWLKSKKYKNRVVPIHSRLKQFMEIFVGTMNQEDRVFPISRIQAYRVVKKHLGISPHQLRHSFAVHWLRSGGDIVVLHRILGHSKIQTTMEYLKIVPIDQAKELDKMDF